ncbi:MAG: T9SS type A sorting domain-containing protein, partial [Bacteroidota bacterium]
DHYGYGIPNLEDAYNASAGFAENELLDFTIYPNPVQDRLFVKLDNYTNASIQIVDLLGKRIANKEMQDQYSSIDMAGLEDGVYIILIRSDNKSATQKFIKQ